MDIIDTLNLRKVALYKASSEVRKSLSEILDDNSFVELNAFSYAKNEFYDEEVQGLGVVTGYATIDGYRVYVVAQNGKVLNGGLSKANCDKISACLNKALDAQMPVIYLLDSRGVQVGEGISVLEGISKMLSLSNEIKGVAPQFAIAIGDVLGSSALLAANAEFTYCVGGACISYSSPSVVAGSIKKVVSKEDVGGAKAKNGVNTFAVKTLSDAKNGIVDVLDVLYGDKQTTDDLNRPTLALDTKKSADAIIKAVFDDGKFIKMSCNYASEVITGIGRIADTPVASIIFDGGADGVELTLENVIKIKNFANFASDNGLKVVNFVNTKGFKADFSTAESAVMQEFMNMLYALSYNQTISVIYGKAIGLGYTAFASRSFGNAYTYAFADAKISLLDGEVGAACEFSTIASDKLDQVKEKYIDLQDAFNAAKIGCVDEIIQPQFVRQYIASAIMSLD